MREFTGFKDKNQVKIFGGDTFIWFLPAGFYTGAPEIYPIDIILGVSPGVLSENFIEIAIVKKKNGSWILEGTLENEGEESLLDGKFPDGSYRYEHGEVIGFTKMNFYRTLERSILNIYKKFGHMHNSQHYNVTIRRSIANNLRDNYNLSLEKIAELISVGREIPYKHDFVHYLLNSEYYDKNKDEFYNLIHKPISIAINKFLKEI